MTYDADYILLEGKCFKSYHSTVGKRNVNCVFLVKNNGRNGTET